MDIVLRPWAPADADALLEACASSPDLERQLPRMPADLAEAAAVIADALGWNETARALAIEVRGRAKGSVAVSAINWRQATGWVSYWIAAPWRGQGIASHCAAAVSTWALHGLGLYRLELGYRANNPASGAVAAAAGFIPEGLERAKLRYGDQRFDVVTCSRLLTDPSPPRTPASTWWLPERPPPTPRGKRFPRTDYPQTVDGRCAESVFREVVTRCLGVRGAARAPGPRPPGPWWSA